MVVEDVRRDPHYRYADIARQEKLCSLLCVPLRVRERIVGVFSCYTGEPHTFTPQEIGLFQTLANQTALASENAHLVVNTAVVREMHHRVKNNLQTIAMLLRLQLGEGDQIDAQEALCESINRILSIAAVHEVLSEKGFRLVDVRQVLDQVAQTVVQNRLYPHKDLRVEVRGDEITLPSRSATALTLAVNELIQNAVKHAFVGREVGSITVTLCSRPPGFEVEVQDDGVGLAPGEPPPHSRSAEPSSWAQAEGRSRQSLGLQIVEALVGQDLGGQLNIERNGRGTCVTIRVPNLAGGGETA
jgi:two-component sensor histidine kinase